MQSIIIKKQGRCHPEKLHTHIHSHLYTNTHSTSAVEPSTSTVAPSTSDDDNALIDLDPYSDNKSQKEMSKIKKLDKAELKNLS